MSDIKTKAPKVGKEVTVSYDFGADDQATLDKFGLAVVVSAFKAETVISIQALVRRCLEAGLTPEEIQAKVDAYKPGVAAERTSDPFKAILAKFEKLDEAGKAEYLSQLKEKLGI